MVNRLWLVIKTNGKDEDHLFQGGELIGTVVHVAVDNLYAGYNYCK